MCISLPNTAAKHCAAALDNPALAVRVLRCDRCAEGSSPGGGMGSGVLALGRMASAVGALADVCVVAGRSAGKPFADAHALELPCVQVWGDRMMEIGSRKESTTWFGSACIAAGEHARTRPLGCFRVDVTPAAAEGYREALGSMIGPITGEIALGRLGTGRASNGKVAPGRSPARRPRHSQPVTLDSRRPGGTAEQAPRVSVGVMQ